MESRFERMSQEKICSGFERLSRESLAMLLGGKSTVEGTGGCSCGATGSSCGCSSTAVCNCKPPRPIRHVTEIQP